jgi:hypothetical protein
MELLAVLGRDEATNYQSQEIDCTTGDLEVLSSEGIESESTDDDGCELCFRQNLSFLIFQ